MTDRVHPSVDATAGTEVERPSSDPRRSVPDVLAAIDIGTNSVHMVVARVAANVRFEVITRLKEMIRLGSGQGEMKHLESDAIDRAVSALTRCRQLADSLDATVFAVATSAVREARNAADFLKRMTDKGLGPDKPEDVLWNFEKFLIGRDGQVAARFAPTVKPDAPGIIGAIEQALG